MAISYSGPAGVPTPVTTDPLNFDGELSVDKGLTVNTGLQVTAAGLVGVHGRAPVAALIPIVSPTAPGVVYSQAEAQTMKTAVDRIQTILTTIGITT